MILKKEKNFSIEWFQSNSAFTIIKISSNLRRFFLLLNHFKQLIQTRFSLHGFEDPILTHEHEVSFASEVDDLFWTATLADESADFI